MEFYLLSEEEQREAWPASKGAFVPMTSVQLGAREWFIRDAHGDVVDHVQGQGVIGIYPILTAGLHSCDCLSSKVGLRHCMHDLGSVLDATAIKFEL